MSLKKTGDLPLTFPKLSPPLGVSEYYQSKVEERRLKYNPKWDLARDCSAYELITAKRELEYTIETLKTKRKIAIAKRLNFDAQWNELAEKENAYKMSFKKFNKFVKENSEKRERAEKKKADDIALQRRRQQEIEEITESMTYTMKIKSMMETRIKEYRLYEDYLMASIRCATEFRNINDVLGRYDALSEAKIQLARMQEDNLSSLENARSHMSKLVEEKMLSLVGLQNQVSGLETRYTSAKTKSLMWESIVSHIQDNCALKLSELNRVKCAVYSTYKMMCHRQNADVDDVASDDFKNQLAFVKKTLSLMEIVSKKMRNTIDAKRK